MSYTLLILKRAQKELSEIPQDVFDKICNEIQSQSDNPYPHGAKKLTGRSGWRIRYDDYRIIYEVDDSGKTLNCFAYL